MWRWESLYQVGSDISTKMEGLEGCKVGDGGTGKVYDWGTD